MSFRGTPRGRGSSFGGGRGGFGGRGGKLMTFPRHEWHANC